MSHPANVSEAIEDSEVPLAAGRPEVTGGLLASKQKCNKLKEKVATLKTQLNTALDENKRLQQWKASVCMGNNVTAVDGLVVAYNCEYKAEADAAAD